jgi:hypothetical protein
MEPGAPTMRTPSLVPAAPVSPVLAVNVRNPKVMPALFMRFMPLDDESGESEGMFPPKKPVSRCCMCLTIEPAWPVQMNRLLALPEVIREPPVAVPPIHIVPLGLIDTLVVCRAVKFAPGPPLLALSIVAYERRVWIESVPGPPYQYAPLFAVVTVPAVANVPKNATLAFMSMLGAVCENALPP